MKLWLIQLWLLANLRMGDECMSNRKWLTFLCPIALAVVLGACSGTTEETNNLSAATEQATSTAEAEHPAPTATLEPAQTANAEPAPSEAPSGESDTDLPQYMPEGFPFPDDVKITTSYGAENEGKKSVMLIFETEQSMKDVTKLYNDYFKSLNLKNMAQTIDDSGLIIQGNSQEEDEAWSLIGSPLVSREGIVELTFTWGEI
jgi:hypothetical protein